MSIRLLRSMLYFVLLCAGLIIWGNTGTDSTPVYREVQVRSGDTLWSLAAAYAGESSTDIREVIYHIRQINALAYSTELHPGMILRIPVVPYRQDGNESMYLAQHEML